MEQVGNRIKEIRISKGFSQEELATKSNVSIRTIQRIEKHENTPHGKTLQLICEALGVQAEDVLEFNQSEDTRILSWMYFSIISGLALPLGNIILPLIFWLTNKSKIKDADKIGKHLVYNQIIISIVVFSILIMTAYFKINHIYPEYNSYGFILFFLLAFLNYLFAFYAGFKANKGRYLRYLFFR